MAAARGTRLAPRRAGAAAGDAETADAARSARTRGGRAAGWLGNALLNLAALGGLICLVLVILAFTANITLIMFKTGSMSPTIPAGSVALVQQVDASTVSVGDVVTVDRVAALPITHRVTSVSPVPVEVGLGPEAREITMRGDANDSDDPVPYTVSTVRTVLGSVPGLAYFVVGLSNPFVLGGFALGASLLVTWAFWPRGPGRGGGQVERGEAGENGETSANGETDADAHAAGSASAVATRGARLLAVCLAAGLGWGLGVPATADTLTRATPTEQVIVGEHLELTAIGDPAAMADLEPRDVVQWEVGVDVVTGEPGQVSIGISAVGSAALGLEAQVTACSERWVEGVCASGATVLRSAHLVPVDGVERYLAGMTNAQQTWLLFDVWRGPTAVSTDTAQSVQLTVHASGLGEDIAASPGQVGSLPSTGVNPLMPALLAGAAVLLGLLAAALAAQRRRTRPTAHAPVSP